LNSLGSNDPFPGNIVPTKNKKVPVYITKTINKEIIPTNLYIEAEVKDNLVEIPYNTLLNGKELAIGFQSEPGIIFVSKPTILFQ